MAGMGATLMLVAGHLLPTVFGASANRRWWPLGPLVETVTRSRGKYICCFREVDFINVLHYIAAKIIGTFAKPTGATQPLSTKAERWRVA